MIPQAPVYLTRDDAIVRVRHNRLVACDHDGAVIRSLPLASVSEVVVVGRNLVTPEALARLLAVGAPVVFLDGAARCIGRLEPTSSRAAVDRQVQLRRSIDSDSCMEVGRAIVAAKIANQRALLRRRRHWRRNASTRDALARLDHCLRRCAGSDSMASLLGAEGAAAYFGALRSFLPPNSGFVHRQRRADDVFNVVVNYLSGVLRETVVSAITVVGLAPDVSFLHRPAANRPTFAFDVMEEWRPVLVESVALALVGLRSVSAADIEVVDGQPRLSRRARHACVGRFADRLDARAVDARDGDVGTHRRAIHRQILRLRSWMHRRQPYAGFSWR